MGVLASVVDWADMAEVAGVSLVAGLGVVFSYSLLMYGVIRALEARSGGETGRLVLFGAIGAAGGLLFGGALVFGLVSMLAK